MGYDFRGSALIDSRSVYPGDLPWPETFATLGLLFTLVLFTVGWMLLMASLWRPRLHRASTGFLYGSAVTATLSSLCLIPVYQRNVGDWAVLKACIRLQDEDLQRFRTVHPDLTTEEVGRRFRASDPGPWECHWSLGYRPVRLLIRPLYDGPHIAVNFGEHDYAVFDPDTMWVIFSE